MQTALLHSDTTETQQLIFAHKKQKTKQIIDSYAYPNTEAQNKQFIWHRVVFYGDLDGDAKLDLLLYTNSAHRTIRIYLSSLATGNELLHLANTLILD